MNIRNFGLSLTISALLSGLTIPAFADSNKEEAERELKQIESEYKAFEKKLKESGNKEINARTISKIKAAMLTSEKAHNDDVKKLMAFFGPNEEFTSFINKTMGNMSDDELINAAKGDLRRNMENIGDVTQKINDGKKAEEILDATEKLQKAAEKIANNFPARSYDLDNLIYQDYVNSKLGQLNVKLDKIPDDPKSISLTFSNKTDLLSFTNISMTIEIKGEGRDVPYYSVKNIQYPFLTPLKPGEERQEIISCRTDCQKAFSHENAYGAIDVTESFARVKNSNRLLYLRKATDWDKSVNARKLKDISERREKIVAAVKLYEEEKNKLETLLK